MKAAIYSRVSTDKQTTENQTRELLAIAERNGWTVEAVYSDVISGAKEKRPELDTLMTSVLRREIDIVLIWDISRLGRGPYSTYSSLLRSSTQREWMCIFINRK